MLKTTGLSYLLLGLLLCAALAQAARPLPPDFRETREPLVAPEKHQKGAAAEACRDDECLTRRTLAAHLDYIYTQENKN